MDGMNELGWSTSETHAAYAVARHAAGWLRRIGALPTSLDEVTQDLWGDVTAAVPSPQAHQPSPDAYVAKVIWNRARNIRRAVRRQRAQATVCTCDIELELPDPTARLERQVMVRQTLARLRRLLDPDDWALLTHVAQFDSIMASYTPACGMSSRAYYLKVAAARRRADALVGGERPW